MDNKFPKIFLISIIIILSMFLSCNNPDKNQSNEIAVIESDNKDEENIELKKSNDKQISDEEKDIIKSIFVRDSDNESNIVSNNERIIEYQKILQEINGKTYYYPIEVLDKNKEMYKYEDIYTASYDIIYNAKYKVGFNDISQIPENIPYCKIIYNEFSKPLKIEYYNENYELNEILLIIYNDLNHLVSKEIKFDEFNQPISEIEYLNNTQLKKNIIYYTESGEISMKIENKYDNGKLIEEVVSNDYEIIENYKYMYEEKYTLKSQYNSAGELISENYLDKNNNVIKSNYYYNNGILLYNEEMEYKKNKIVKKKCVDNNEKTTTLITFDIDEFPLIETRIDNKTNNYERKEYSYEIINDIKLLSVIKIYKDNSDKVFEEISYFYTDDGELSNWLRYDSTGKLISSMDNQEY